MGGVMVQVVFFLCGVKSEEPTARRVPTAVLTASVVEGDFNSYVEVY